MKTTINDLISNKAKYPLVNRINLDYCLVFDEKNQLLSSPDNVEVMFGVFSLPEDILALPVIFYDIFSLSDPTFISKFIPILNSSPQGSAILSKITKYDSIIVITAKKE